MTKPNANAESGGQDSAGRTRARQERIADTFVVVDGRGGISVDLGRMLSSEKGKRSIEKLRKVRLQKQ